MSLKKKDPALRVAANDPHLVSLGGGRLSTAVTIHYIPIGDMTIGSSPTCSISLNGSGVRPVHCTIYRSEENEVTIVPEPEARILIDGTKLSGETNLTQGAMITIGNSNYLRFNNPAEAQLIRSAMGSNERISMPQIDFTQVPRRNSGRSSSNGSEEAQIEAFYESKIHPKECKLIEDIDINGLTCPKVFTADSVTVNTPAKDVLGPKYANFAKNLAEIHRNNEKNQKMNNYVNIPAAGFQHQHNLNLNSSSSSINGSGNEILQKVNNNFSNNRNTTPYDRYPKSQGGLQLFPMNGVNNEINTSSPAYRSESPASNNSSQHNITAHESERLEEILKICTEYDRQNQSSVSSSPIVQNRIKTNGSLPREKKGPFYEHSPQHTGSSKTFFQEKAKGGTGYENVRILSDRRVEIGGGVGSGGGTGGGVGGGGGSVIGSPKSGYENVIVGRYTPQSPRTKIRTTCMSPKKDSSYNNSIFHSQQQNNLVTQPQQQTSTTDYEQLIQTFEDKLKMEMEAIQDSSRLASPPASVVDSSSPSKRVNKNINNLTLDLSLVEKEKEKEKQKPVPAVRTVKTNMTVPVATSSEFVGDIDKLKKTRKKLLIDIQSLKTQISELQRQEDETLREMDMEKALVTAEVTSIKKLLSELEASFTALQTKIHRLEAQRNAARVMEENQQAKLKQTIAIKQDQTKRLNQMLKEKPLDECLKEEFEKCSESLENDRKTFEDLEFQYLEEETEWQAYREELHMEQKDLSSQIDEKRTELRHLENQEAANHNSASSDARALKSNLILLVNELRTNQEQLRALETNIADITGELDGYSDPSSEDDRCDDDDGDVSAASPEEIQHGIMSQSLFGSAELLCPKRHTEDIMSKSVNENMFYNNKIEILSQQPATSTPKRQLKAVNIDDDLINAPPPALPPKSNRNSEDLPSIEDKVVRRLQREETDPLLKLKYNVNDEETQERVNFNLSLGSDDFEVNPLERRIPSQDDIDRICKVTSDAPISTKGASNKIFDSIKEIERNRQLLLAQQGCHVIEHERQKMLDLKKKSHDEARAQYLSMLSTSLDNSTSNKNVTASPETDNLNDKENHHHHHQQLPQQQVEDADKKISSSTDGKQSSGTNKHTTNGESSSNDQSKSSQNRHSQPELESQRSRPLSDANSELSCDLLSENTYKSSIELSSSCGNGGSGGSAGGGGGANCNGGGNRHSEQSDDGKRSSVNSNDTTSSDRLISGSKRMLPKHQRPLTRYLPISSPDLDLRLHIESAGHQIAQCPHVFVDSYSCRGYLHKLGATFHGWSRRWFVLDRERSAFIYYSDKSERKPRGGAYFSTIDEVYLDHLNASKSGRPHCTFIVKTKKRSYHLQASSDAAARIWIDAIITGAQGNLDY